MSIHSRHKTENNNVNVATLLLDLLASEEANVESTEEEVTKRLASIENHRMRIEALKAAIKVFEVDSQEPIKKCDRKKKPIAIKDLVK